jgi:hypothetical protein
VSRAVAGLYFVGLPFQSSFASATLRGVGSDAKLVVSRVRRRVTRSLIGPTGRPASFTPPRCSATMSGPPSEESRAAGCPSLERTPTCRRMPFPRLARRDR